MMIRWKGKAQRLVSYNEIPSHKSRQGALHRNEHWAPYKTNVPKQRVAVSLKILMNRAGIFFFARAWPI